MAQGFLAQKIGYGVTTNVEQIPQVKHYGTRPKYMPTDWTGHRPYSEVARTYQTVSIFEDGKTGVKKNILNAVGKMYKGGQVKVSKNYNKAQDMIEEGRRSPISQTFAFRQRIRPLRVIHNPTRKMYEEAYSQPIQFFGFKKTRQMNAPAAKRAFNRGQSQVQPNVKTPTPTAVVPTQMPWNIAG